MSLPAHYTILSNFMKDAPLTKEEPVKTRTFDERIQTIVFSPQLPLLSWHQTGALLFELNKPINTLVNDFESSYTKYNVLRKNGIRLNAIEELWLDALTKVIPYLRSSCQSDATKNGEMTTAELNDAADSLALKSLHILLAALIQFYMFDMSNT